MPIWSSIFSRKKHRTQAQAAKKTYMILAEHARDPVFYENYQVPDNTNGRFDMITAHAALVIHRLKNESLYEKNDGAKFNQALFDAVFKHIDQSFREHGVGDTGVKIRIKKMMAGFNGRVQAYDKALDTRDEQALIDVVARNIYATATNPNTTDIKALADYLRHQEQFLQTQATPDLLEGRVMLQSVTKKGKNHVATA